LDNTIGSWFILCRRWQCLRKVRDIDLVVKFEIEVQMTEEGESS
jgi:hypothetical protein